MEFNYEKELHNTVVIANEYFDRITRHIIIKQKKSFTIIYKFFQEFCMP